MLLLVLCTAQSTQLLGRSDDVQCALSSVKTQHSYLLLFHTLKYICCTFWANLTTPAICQAARLHCCKQSIVRFVPTLIVHVFAMLGSCALQNCFAVLTLLLLCKAVTLLQDVSQGCSSHKSELYLAARVAMSYRTAFSRHCSCSMLQLLVRLPCHSCRHGDSIAPCDFKAWQ